MIEPFFGTACPPCADDPARITARGIDDIQQVLSTHSDGPNARLAIVPPSILGLEHWHACLEYPGGVREVDAMLMAVGVVLAIIPFVHGYFVPNARPDVKTDVATLLWGPCATFTGHSRMPVPCRA